MKVELAATADVPPGERTFVTINQVEFCIWNYEGEYYVFRNFCPHMGAPLGQGGIREDDDTPYVLCPFHRWAFDLETGESKFNPEINIQTLDASVEDDTIVIETDEF